MFYFLERWTKEKLLDHIDEMAVWTKILGYSPKLGHKILSPFRSDSKPSCVIVSYGGRIVFIDWARGVRYDAVSAYILLHPGKVWLEVVDDLLSMAISTKPVYAEKKVNSLFPIYRDWDDRDKVFWTKRNIRKKQLDRHTTLVRPSSGFTYGGGETNHFSLSYAYHHHDKVKIYFPEDRPTGSKFLGNMNRDTLWMLQRDSDVLLVSKSHKDMLVLENICPFDLTHVQSETSLPSQNIIDRWSINYKKIFIFFDNDEAGVANAQKLCEKINGHVRTIMLQDFKDIDEMVVKTNIQTATKAFKSLIQ